jgi:hypothetical protein
MSKNRKADIDRSQLNLLMPIYPKAPRSAEPQSKTMVARENLSAHRDRALANLRKSGLGVS